MMISDVITPEVHTVAIVGHVRPDGDCAGSVTALYTYLRDNYPEITVVPYLDPLTHEIAFLGKKLPIKKTDGASENYDLAFSLDCALEERIGAGAKAFSEAKKKVCIDHHMTNPGYADENVIVEHATSTCEVLVSLMEMDKISDNTAMRLFTGIMTDSGALQFDTVSSETLRIVLELREKNVDYSGIIRKCVTSTMYSILRITAKVILDSEMIPLHGGKSDGNLLFATASLALQKEYGVPSSELGSIVQKLNDTEEATAVIFFYETTPGVYKGSLRSKKGTDVATIAKAFRGGGHINAAGFETTDIPAALEFIKDKLQEQLSKA